MTRLGFDKSLVVLCVVETLVGVCIGNMVLVHYTKPNEVEGWDSRKNSLVAFIRHLGCNGIHTQLVHGTQVAKLVAK